MDRKCSILFSGGLDSSLAVCYMVERNYKAELIHFDTGALISNDLTRIRYNELVSTYGDGIADFHKIRVAGLFRKIALTQLEKDILKHGTNLICVGCKLAMHVQNIVFCKRNNIGAVADGSTERQKRYGEQREVTLKYLFDLYKKYDIEYNTPVYKLDEKEIKYGLFDRGMTIQPLEDTCLFSNTFSIASDEAVESYLIDKIEMCIEIIERSLSYE